MKRKRKEIYSLTVGELIDILQEFPKDLKVIDRDDFGDPVEINKHIVRRALLWEQSVDYKSQEVVHIHIPQTGNYVANEEYDG